MLETFCHKIGQKMIAGRGGCNIFNLPEIQNVQEEERAHYKFDNFLNMVQYLKPARTIIGQGPSRSAAQLN